ncbi:MULTISPECIES: ribonuclease HI family protein [unclassified Staphylococcus]|uniref:ribonuclease HI family protein n=1 Tax=unclassified Staphylococcus TaxID=91994 RepID=UPI0021D194CA|nr:MULTISPECIES: ribonuclease HI family protein [unclassified Staphylococcus]UXR70819.1 ribonuclease HI family protein [Staphylococcus sp. IVB6240]UXR73048.1 ribonuclease HI family protein [Staphylococcus sp. IVB6238]UXR75344.1 ribonuclease HI family protein [Staphylococcus sp. IVB6233]UXR79547.1 ribonuclease HI family protein [Staphylococcus sp. IVB6218]
MAKIYFDAATKGNPGVSTCGVVIVEESERHTYSQVLGEMDNHSAEWESLIFALEQAKQLQVTNALIYTDSQLIEDVVNRNFVKNKRFKPYLDRFNQLSQAFDLCFVKWIPRAQNKEANQLAQQTLYRVTKQ